MGPEENEEVREGGEGEVEEGGDEKGYRVEETEEE